MTKWVWQGLRTGIKTTVYPDSPETAAGVSPGRPAEGTPVRKKEIRPVMDLCPTNALLRKGDRVSVDYRRCIHCFRCKRLPADPLRWESGYEWGGFCVRSGGI